MNYWIETCYKMIEFWGIANEIAWKLVSSKEDSDQFSEVSTQKVYGNMCKTIWRIFICIFTT